MHVLVNDQVRIMTGKDRGKRGRVLRVLPKQQRVVVEGINQIKKHAKATAKQPHGGILTLEAPIAASNVSVICPECGQPTRVKRTATATEHIRVCRRCGAALSPKKDTE
ncbi:50S ribosomal protein L24 [Candidatus Berkelbacteria bacterium]|nr:50S ribosomal protein L24 [Candidatus Berkelbacteria bacterium]